MGAVTNSRLAMSDVSLMASLMAIAFVGAVNSVIVSRIAFGEGVEDIIGQIEWFDTINETALAFLVLPMYNLLNSVRGNTEAFRNRISQMTVYGFTIYLAFTVLVMIYASSIAAGMNAPAESVDYLRLKTVGFLFDYLVQIVMVILVVMGKTRNVNIMIVAKVAALAVCYIILMGRYSFMGEAYASIIVNIAMVVVCAFILKHEGLIQLKPKYERETISQWLKVGGFSGGEILLNNLIYVLMVCMMVNAVSESGNYWTVNNFIWGWLLVPIYALAEIVRRDYKAGVGRMRAYLVTLVMIYGVWFVSVPVWGLLYGDVFGVTDVNKALDITYKLIPFYLAYGICAVIDAIFLSTGKTVFLVIKSAIVNIGYYGILYALYSKGIVQVSMDFIILMFGFGMVIGTIVAIILFLKYRSILEAGNTEESKLSTRQTENSPY